MRSQRTLTPERQTVIEAGRAAACRLVAEWEAARAAVAEAARAAHPDITDRFGRVWIWLDGDLYTHDATLAFTRSILGSDRLGLPPARLVDNPNYAGLCDICRSEWPKERP